jgi:hypothetical protein
MAAERTASLRGGQWLLHCWACASANPMGPQHHPCACGRSSGRTVPSGGVVIVGPARALHRARADEPWQAVPEGPAVIRPSIVA